MYYKKRIDPLTGELYIPKRYNQKFATKQNQIDYNNIKARKKRHLKIGVDRILDKNREVLKSILKNRRSIIISKDFLLGAGFNMNHFSGLFKIDDQDIYAIYEYTLLRRENGNFLIEKQ